MTETVDTRQSGVPRGDTIGRYRLLEEIGTGGMGVVYLAEVMGVAPQADEESPDDLPEPGSRVAVKVLHPHLVSTKDFAQRFRREARVGAAIVHPNLVRTIEAGAAELRGTATSYLAMEYAQGQTLRALIDELGTVPEEFARAIARQVLSAMEAIHDAGITHRDLKPENVIITPDHQVKLMDLGIAKVRDASIRLSLTGEFLGSIHYASPEQFQAPDKVGPTADLYAVGVLLYEMLAGQNPFYHSDFRVVLRRTLSDLPARLSATVPDVSPVLDQMVWNLLQKNPDARLPSATAVLTVLDQGEESAWWQDAGRAAWERTGRQARTMQVRRETALVGRDTELTTLRKYFDKAAGGACQVVFLEGEAGVGKTRLLDAFAESLEKAGVAFRLAFGNAKKPGVGRPFQAFSEALLGVLDPEDLPGSLAELLPEDAPIESFARYLEGAPGASEELSLDAVRSLFAGAFRALARQRTLVLVLDDLHLAGENSVNMLAYLARDDRHAALLLVAAHRPPEDEHTLTNLVQGTRDAWVHLMKLDRLGPRDVGLLLREALQSERAVQELGFALLEKTEGNPFFIFEVLRTLKRDNVLYQTRSGGWSLAETRIEIHVPDSVKELIETALAKLADEDRELLEVAAVAGNEFDPEVLTEVLGVAKIPLLRRLSSLERKHRMIRSVGRRCRFEQPQVRDTLYDGLMPGLREEYHAVLGRMLQTKLGAAEGDPEEIESALLNELAHHLVHGGCAGEASRYILPALRHCAANYQSAEGLRLCEAFLETAARDPDAVPAQLRAEVLLEQAAFCEHEGGRTEQGEALESARALVAGLDDPELERRVLHRGIAYQFQRGKFDEAALACRKVLQIASRQKDHEAAVAALANLASALRGMGRYTDAASAARRALSWILRTQSKLRRCLLFTILGLIEVHRGHQRSAQQVFLQALEIARGFGVPKVPRVRVPKKTHEEASRSEFVGLSRALARYAESRIDGERMLLLETGLPRRLHEAAALLALGVLAGQLNRLTDARAVLLGALEATREEGDTRFEAAVIHALGESAIQAHNPELGREHFIEALELRRKIGYRPGVCESLLALGQLAAMGGAVEAARPYLDEAMEVAPALDMPGIAALARATAALLYARSGRRDRAREELEEAQQALSTGPLTVSSRAEGLYFAALAARALDDESACDSYMWRAYDLIQEVAHGLKPEERNAFLRGTSPNREIVEAVGMG